MSITEEQYQKMLKRGQLIPLSATSVPFLKAKGKKEPRKKTQNKSETAYGLVLEARKRAGEIIDYKFEGMTLKLGDDCRLTPDFLVIDSDGFIQFHDVKAFWKSKGKAHVEDDAKVKLAVAASTIFPYFEFRIVWLEGTWQHKTY